MSAIEQASGIGEIGTGLQITPNGSAVLAGLGLTERLSAIGNRASYVEVRDYLTGKLLFRFDLDRYCRAASSPYLLVHRADLIEILTREANELDIEFHFSKRVDDVVLHDDSVECLIVGGESLCSSFLVGADGIRSVTHKVLNGASHPASSQYQAWRTLIPSEQLDLDMRPETVRIFVGPRRHVVNYWLRERSLLNVVAVKGSLGDSAAGSKQCQTKENMLCEFWGACDLVRSVLEASESVDVWELSSGNIAKSWTGSRIALIGDALHPILPTLAQGANQAFEDAWVLASELQRQENLPDALSGYRKRRRTRLAKVLRYTKRQAWLDHLAFPPTRHVSHKILEHGSRAAPNLFASRYDWLFGKNITIE